MSISNKEFETIFHYWFFYGDLDANSPETCNIPCIKDESKNFVEFIDKLIKFDKEHKNNRYTFRCFAYFVGDLVIPPRYGGEFIQEEDYTLQDITKIKTKMDNYIKENGYTNLLKYS